MPVTSIVTPCCFVCSSSCCHHCALAVQGISDLFMLPLQQYHRDGRVVHGLQRGAASFGMLTTVSLLQLSSQGILMLQVRHWPKPLYLWQHLLHYSHISSFSFQFICECLRSGSIGRGCTRTYMRARLPTPTRTHWQLSVLLINCKLSCVVSVCPLPQLYWDRDIWHAWTASA